MTNTTYRSTVRDAADDLSNTAASVANDAKQRASAIADDVADGVADAASRVHERASEIGKQAVDQFNATADYFREHDVKEIASDVNAWVKAHPTQALIGAVALGFVAGALLRRR